MSKRIPLNPKLGEKNCNYTHCPFCGIKGVVYLIEVNYPLLSSRIKALITVTKKYVVFASSNEMT